MKRLSRTGIRVIVRSGLVWLALATAAGEEIHPPPSANHPLSVIYSEKLISDVDPNDARAATQFWITGLVKQRWPDAEATATILGSLEAIVKAVRENRGDIVALLPLDYLEIKDRVDLVPAYSPTVNGRPKASFSLLVRRDGPQTLDGLRHKRLAVPPGWKDEVSWMWMEALLSENGQARSGVFFSEIRQVTKSSQAVLSVLFGQSDVCVVATESYDTMVELNPQLGRDLAVVARSPEYLRAVICVDGRVYRGYGRELEESLLALHTEPQGRQVMNLFRINRLIPFEPGHLEGILRMVEAYRAIKPAVGVSR